MASSQLARKLHLPKELWKKSWKIVKGDTVEVLDGKDKGRRGIVKLVLRPYNSVVVEGINLAKKNVKSTPEHKGGMYTKEQKIEVSKVALIDPVNDKPTKVAMRYLEDGSKVRIAKLSGAVIPKPTYTRKDRPKDGPLDTPQDAVHERTYFPEFFTTTTPQTETKPQTK